MKVVSLFSGCGGLDYGLHQVRCWDVCVPALAAGAARCAPPAGAPALSWPSPSLYALPRPPTRPQAGHEIILQCENDPGAQQVRRRRPPAPALDRVLGPTLPRGRMPCVDDAPPRLRMRRKGEKFGIWFQLTPSFPLG